MSSHQAHHPTLIVKNLITMAIAPGTVSDFEDNTTQGWSSGRAHPNPPSVVADSGPDGTGDEALLVQASGSGGPGSSLVWFNESSDWTGDFVGISAISAWVNNVGNEDLTLRVALHGDGGGFASATGNSVIAGSGWQQIEFSVEPTALAATDTNQVFLGGTDINATLENVTHVRLLHHPDVSIVGEPIMAQLQLDDITAVASSSLPPTNPTNPSTSPILGTDADDNLKGDGSANEIQGGRGSDVLRGKGGKDTLIGGAGKDRLLGGTGKDELLGDGGKDTLRGGAGNDTLSGGGGSDTLQGDRGKDELTGGGGKDTFVIRSKDGLDTITDFQNGRDRIQLKGRLNFDGLSFNQRGDNVLIQSNRTKLLLVLNTTVDDFSEADFI